ncbi:hypothetical protein N9A86_03750 [Akkermansiaceae bacterium]|nr:hypothetical protein [Akkermansiaceae bacterium]
MQLSLQFLIKNAPKVFLGAFFLCASCKEESSSATSAKTEEATPAEVAPEATPAKADQDAESPASPDEIRFLSYNLKNHLTMKRFPREGPPIETSKPEKEIAALIEIIVNEEPDILGICEIGTKDDLADLQARLKQAGLDLPHTVHAGGRDETRHLGLLSALPIVRTDSEHHLSFTMGDDEYLMSRGILDATITLPNGPTRFIGVHLKSKRPSEAYDEAEMRLHEARLLREHVDDIQEKDPEARVVVYGDFNETRKMPPLSMIMGRKGSKDYLGDIFVKDSRKELWTHFWSYQQQYARFDYVLVSNSVMPEVNFSRSHIVDPPNWNDASDHRAIVVAFGR